MESRDIAQGRRRGRPLSFDRDDALKRAMLLFWKHGYEGTSLGDLTAAMGVTPPSIYAAFGDKKHLFLEAVQHYVSGPSTAEAIIDGAATAEQAARKLLTSAAKGFTGPDTPLGCLLATATISCSASAADVQDVLAEIRRGIEGRLKAKIKAAIMVGEICQDADCDALAGLIMAVIQGMSTLARDGAPRGKLMAIAEHAMRTWPGIQVACPQSADDQGRSERGDPLPQTSVGKATLRGTHS